VFKNLIDQVQWAKDAGVYIIIAYHVTDDSSLWNNGSIYSQYLNDWVALATQFKNDSHVLYEILNEPAIDETYKDTYANFVKETIEKIRGTGDDHVIIVDGLWYASPDPKYYTFASALTSYSNIVLSFHYYKPEDFVWQGCYWNTTVCKTYRYTSTSLTQSAMDNIISDFSNMRTNVSVKYNMPLFVGEVGIPQMNFVYKTGGDRAQSMIESSIYFRDVKTNAERNNFSWSLFTYRDPLDNTISCENNTLACYKQRQFCLFSGWGKTVEDMLISGKICSDITCEYYIRQDMQAIVNIVGN
jgi:aryl-phospho-beta-D-glucosidase BglC (GH1 family)